MPRLQKIGQSEVMKATEAAFVLMRRITDITERLLTVSINESTRPGRPPLLGAEANSRGFHETLFILAFARDLPRAHRA